MLNSKNDDRRPQIKKNVDTTGISKMVSSSLLCCFVPLALKRNLAYHTSSCATDNVLPRLLRRSQSLAVSSTTSSADDDILPVIREAVTKAGGDDCWRESLQVLSGLIEDDDAELYLATAFGWKDWAKAPAKMKQLKDKVLPDPAKVQEALVWLTEGPLELSEDQVRRSIQEYPRLYLVDPKELYRKVNGVAPRKYRELLKELIQNDPNALQVTYNCDGEGCASQCGSCWVTYANRLA
jgi:hypothetical protein